MTLSVSLVVFVNLGTSFSLAVEGNFSAPCLFITDSDLTFALIVVLDKTDETVSCTGGNLELDKRFEIAVFDLLFFSCVCCPWTFVFGRLTPEVN